MLVSRLLMLRLRLRGVNILDNHLTEGISGWTAIGDGTVVVINGNLAIGKHHAGAIIGLHTDGSVKAVAGDITKAVGNEEDSARPESSSQHYLRDFWAWDL